MKSYDALLSIEFADQTRHWSILGTSTEDTYFEPRLTSVNSSTRAVRPDGGVVRIGAVSVVMEDADGAIRLLSAQQPFRNRPALLKARNLETGAESVLLRGYVRSRKLATGKVTLDLRDDTLDKLLEPIRLRVIPEIFNLVPNRTDQALIPIVFGNVQSLVFSDQGHIPAYLIDPGVGSANFKYVAAQHILKSVINVYHYGEVLNPDFYTVSHEAVPTPLGNIPMTFLNFNVEMRMRSRSGHEVTYDAQGMTDTGLETGAVITNPARQVEAFLELQGVVDSLTEIDQVLLSAAATAYATAGITSAGAVTGENETWASVLDKFGEGVNLQFWTTGGGLYGIRYEDASSPSGILPKHRDQEDIIRGTFLEQEDSEDSASTLEPNYGYDHARNKWDTSTEYKDATAETQLGRDVRRKDNFWYIRDRRWAKAIARAKLFQTRPERMHYQYAILPDLSLELADGVELTHFSGPTNDAVGFVDKKFRIYGSRVSINKTTARQVLTVLDAPGLTGDGFTDEEPNREDTDIPAGTGGGYAASLVFIPVDHNAVEWSLTGTERIFSPAGSYVIAYGTTGVMTAETFIYWDPNVSVNVLQTTIDPADFANESSLLVCKARPGGVGEQPHIEPIYGFALIGRYGIGTNTIVSTHITDEAIITPKLAANSVIAGKIAAGAVTTEKLFAEAVIASKIAAEAVTTVKLFANAVTTEKLAADAVTANELWAFAVNVKHTIIAAKYMTGEDFPRIEIDSNSLRSYNASGSMLLEIPTTGGQFIGNLVVLSASSSPGSIYFRDAVGAARGRISSSVVNNKELMLATASGNVALGKLGSGGTFSANYIVVEGELGIIRTTSEVPMAHPLTLKTNTVGAPIKLSPGNTVMWEASNTAMSFFGVAPVARPTVTTLAELAGGLNNLGLIVDAGVHWTTGGPVGDLKSASNSGSSDGTSWVTLLTLSATSGFLDEIIGNFEEGGNRSAGVEFEVTVDGGVAQVLGFTGGLDVYNYDVDQYVRRVILGGARFESSVLVRARHTSTGTLTVYGKVIYREDQ